MFFQRLMNRFCCFLVLLPLLSGAWAAAAAQKVQVQVAPPHYANQTIAEKYQLVHDYRNFKAKTKGGKGFGPQGRVLSTLTSSIILNEALVAPHKNLKNAQYPWRYVVAVSCKNEKGIAKKIIKDLVENLLPQQERNRLAIVVNINEKVVGFTEEEKKRIFDINHIVLDEEQKEIAAYGVPVLLLYTPWTSFREDVGHNTLSAEQVRRNIFQELDTLKEGNKRQYDVALAKLNAGDATHKFPFGQMRTHLINNDESKKFLAALHSDDVGLYLHIQDADFTNLKTKPFFYTFGQQVVIPDGEEFLFKRYDVLIGHQIASRGCMPILVGGAYVYEPTEGLKDVSLDSKYWSRFAVEMSNLLKHLVGQYAPFGLYFHEPNTCVLLYAPKGQKVAGGKKLAKKLENLGITFGIDSEVQEFTRKVFKACDDQTRCDAMIFSAQVVLATSMKGDKRGFNIRCPGDYDQANKAFTLQKADDSLCALHGMPQGNVDANAWMNVIATSFARHRKHDSRTVLSELFNLFDPYALSNQRATKPAVFSLNELATTLRDYDEILKKEQKVICEKCTELQARYDKNGSGKKIAYSMVALAWECGQAMRLMFLDHLVLPGAWQAPAQVADIRKLLTYRLDHTHHESGFPTQSYLVGDVLGLNSPAKGIQHDVAWQLVEYMRNDAQSKTQMCKMLQISLPTLNKLIGKKQTPRAIEGIFKHFYDMFKQKKLHTDFGLQASDSEVIVEKVCFS